MTRMIAVAARYWRLTALCVGLVMACVISPGLFEERLQGQGVRRIDVFAAGADGRRVALVIGNSAYTGTSRLAQSDE